MTYSFIAYEWYGPGFYGVLLKPLDLRIRAFDTFFLRRLPPNVHARFLPHTAVKPQSPKASQPISSLSLYLRRRNCLSTTSTKKKSHGIRASKQKLSLASQTTCPILTKMCVDWTKPLNPLETCPFRQLLHLLNFLSAHTGRPRRLSPAMRKYSVSTICFPSRRYSLRMSVCTFMRRYRHRILSSTI